MMITLIAAIGRNNELGYQNKLLCHIPDDLKHFKSYTMGKIVIMGSNTFSSIGKVLPGRKCIVVSSQDIGTIVIHAKTIEDALSIEHCYSELVVIGGASLYNQTIDRADKLVITHIDAEFKADVFFPKIDMLRWKINSVLDKNTDTYNYRIVEYIRNESN